MKINFENNNVPSYIKDIVKSLLGKGYLTNGNISMEEIPQDELELYEDNKAFINKYKEKSDIYVVYQNVCGTWNQPLTLVAVK